MAFSGPISDRLGIRELIETYNDAVNQRDTDSWAATWIQAGVWNLMVQKFEGRNKLTQVWVSAMETYSHVFFTAYPSSIEIQGDEATARVYVKETLIHRDGQTTSVEGVYQDKLVRLDTGWHFAERVYNILHQTQTNQG